MADLLSHVEHTPGSRRSEESDRLCGQGASRGRQSRSRAVEREDVHESVLRDRSGRGGNLQCPLPNPTLPYPATQTANGRCW